MRKFYAFLLAGVFVFVIAQNPLYAQEQQACGETISFINLFESPEDDITFSEISFDNINNEVKVLSNKLKNHQFITLGTTRPDYVDNEVINITEKKNKEELIKKILNISKKIIMM